VWARRAKRAELKAELAAREALLAKQEARMIQEEKQRELEALQQKLLELQSEASSAASERQHSAALAQRYAMRRNDSPTPGPVPSDAPRMNREKLEGVKQRFRDRMAAKKQQQPPVASDRPALTRPPHTRTPTPAATPSPGKPPIDRSLLRSAGEEMFQQMDFYERSLKAVDNTRRN
jgi:hypothetical protein